VRVDKMPFTTGTTVYLRCSVEGNHGTVSHTDADGFRVTWAREDRMSREPRLRVRYPWDRASAFTTQGPGFASE
jgi:hypothetical protein